MSPLNAVGRLYEFGRSAASQAFNAAKTIGKYYLCFDILRPVVTYVHEKGHCLVGDLLFKNANPEITFKLEALAFKNCVITTSAPSAWGSSLGRANATAVVAAAGPLAQIAFLTAVTASSSSKLTARWALSYLGLEIAGLMLGMHTDFERIAEQSTLGYGAMILALGLSTAFVARRAFPKQNEADKKIN